MDIPEHYITIILSIACAVGFILVLLSEAIDTAYSYCNLSEETLEKLSEQSPKRRTQVLWLLDHPADFHRTFSMTKAILLVLSVLSAAILAVKMPKGHPTADWLYTVLPFIFIIVYAAAQYAGAKRPLATLCRFSGFACSTVGVEKVILNLPKNDEQAEKPVTFDVETMEQALEMQESEEEKAMLEGVLHFGEETVSEVMIPRVDVVTLDIQADFNTVMKCAIDNNYSRIPVCDNSQDKIVGILYVKDLMPYCREDSAFGWQQLIRVPYYVPESMMIDALLREFQRGKIHIAVVVDEYGMTCGIVTMEDILEEIVGDINDEYDEEEKQFTRVNDNTYIFEGKTPLSDFFEHIGLPEEDYAEAAGDAETLAGMVLELLGEFPVRHQKTACNQLDFEVLALDKRRISKIKVTRSPQNTVAEDAALEV